MSRHRTSDRPVGTKRKYRCTRPDVYQSNCPGRTDVTARQGHYVVAMSEADAHKIMRKRFPSDSHFDVRVVNESVHDLVPLSHE